MKRLALSSILLVLLALPAQAWFSKGTVPPCDSQQVLANVAQRFAYADTHTFHWGLSIRHVTSIAETPEVIRSRSVIARRYCRGVAWMSDGSHSQVYYLIESHQGFASYGYRVQSCLPAYDPWHVYDSWCRAAQP